MKHRVRHPEKHSILKAMGLAIGFYESASNSGTANILDPGWWTSGSGIAGLMAGVTSYNPQVHSFNLDYALQNFYAPVIGFSVGEYILKKLKLNIPVSRKWKL